MAECSVDGCAAQACKRGWCNAHYLRWHRHGDPLGGPGRGNWETKHGAARRSGRLPEYGIWAGMRRRCENPDTSSWGNYGARGITVCERWQDFANFLADMGPRPTPDHTIERVDNDKGYSPENCIWATRDIQARNRRRRRQKATCSRGHVLSGANVYCRPDGKRGCMTCRRINMKDFYERQRAEASHATV